MIIMTPVVVITITIPIIATIIIILITITIPIIAITIDKATHRITLMKKRILPQTSFSTTRVANQV